MTNEQPKPAININAEKIIFLHIAKTAGTSLVEFFRKILPAEQMMTHGDFVKFPRGHALPPQAIADYRFISGHFGYSYIGKYIKDSYSFTFLRDPVDRVLSFYRFCMNIDMQRQYVVARAARDLTLDQFMTSTRPEIVEMLDNMQTWQLAHMYWQEERKELQHYSENEILTLAKNHLTEFSFVGFTEAFPEGFSRILDDLNIVPEKLNITNVRKTPWHYRTQDPITADQLKPATLAMLKSRMALDYALYDFAKTL
ncbi:MAG: sulfotransferase family 2 domain-containing protein [Pseudomonadales bacterium]